jgi:hypothetical protein
MARFVVLGIYMIGTTKTTQLPLDSIRIDGGTQPRAALDQNVIHEYAQDILLGATFPPVTVFYDGSDYWLADGFHRYHGAKQICRETIDAEIRQGTRRDAVLYSVGTNATHGLRRTNADKRRAVETLLRDEEWSKWSNREIARQSGVDEGTVRNIRSTFTAEIPQLERHYITKHGTEATMNTANIGQQQQNLTPQKFVDEVIPGFTQWQKDNTKIGLDEWADPLSSDNQGPEEPPTQPLTSNTELDKVFPGWHREPVPFQPITVAPVVEDTPDSPQLDAKERRDEHVMRVMGSSDSPEWYTPQEIIDLACQMFGTIDTDPCSNSHETPAVPARTLYTKEDDGLAQTWIGKTYLNPPYGAEISKWTDKLVAEYKSGNVTEALALLPARIDTVWFSPLYEYLMCNVRGRIQFANSPYHAPFPCVIVYLGEHTTNFINHFKSLGPIMRRIA